MRLPFLSVALGVALTAVSPVSPVFAQQTDPQLTGTWTTKSRKVLTGPGFYNPVSDEFFEPKLTGQSYSFSEDGHYETAIYRAISNPAQPNCPQGIMQWQHGTYTKNSSGFLILEPFKLDGRQLYSNPCENKNGVYSYYNQTEIMKTYRVYTDPYNNLKRLDLFQFDGAPQNPMWIAFDPPQMLPTQSYDRSATGTAAAKSTSTGKSKRSLEGGLTDGAQLVRNLPKTIVMERSWEDRLWWIVAISTVISSIFYLKSWKI